MTGMNRLPVAIAVIAATLAAGLWLLASKLEQSVRESPPLVTSRDLAGPTPQTVTSDEDSPDCGLAEADIRTIVDRARGCGVDSDCAIFDYGYPIECLTSVARTQISYLRQQFSRYHESCEYRVYYDCPTGDLRRKAVCRNKRCEIDLVSVDELTEDTLDYLGVD